MSTHVAARFISEHVGAQNRRFVVELGDGARVESVIYRGDTVCLSSQVGCAVRCSFCASGANGLRRSLSHDELVAQLDAAIEVEPKISRVTLSGVGEPLHNHAASVALLHVCRDRGLKLSLTTSGGTLARFREWLSLPHNGLTLSVHAGTEHMRARLVPRAPSLEELFGALADELPKLTRRRKKKTALAYLLLAGHNDGEDELDAFVARAEPLGLPVHLYAYNPVATNDHRAVTRAAFEQAYARVARNGLIVRMSSTARVEANGGCGTLVALRGVPSGGVV